MKIALSVALLLAVWGCGDDKSTTAETVDTSDPVADATDPAGDATGTDVTDVLFTNRDGTFRPTPAASLSGTYRLGTVTAPTAPTVRGGPSLPTTCVPG